MNQRPEPSTFEDPREVARWRPPSRLGAMVFAAKVSVFQVRRAITDLGSPARRRPKGEGAGFDVLLAEASSPLWSDERVAERAHQMGKVENLRRAARALDGVMLGAGEVFSFWKQVGRASRRRGFVTGRMLQGGCLVPAVGGGLCQISNGLYGLALDSGCEIVERHAHSRVVPGSASTVRRDATVAWNYVDLRFRAPRTLRLEARLSADAMTLRFWGRGEPATPGLAADVEPVAASLSGPEPSGPTPRSCATCDETACFRHETRPSARAGRRAWLVDDNPPEFTAWLAAEARLDDVLGLPLDGGRLGLARYRWPTQGLGKVGSAALPALWRAAQMRRLAQRGAERRAAEIAGAGAIARSLSRLLTHDVTEVVVAQSLAPFLWSDGWLGGRRFKVLMTRPPMGALQAVLDAAFVAHMDRPSLADFRAPSALVAAEAEALAAADQLISPHAEVARLFPAKTLLLDWAMPSPPPAAAHDSARATARRRIAFPGPTAARKGAWAVREAARALDLEVMLLGAELERPDFWAGVSTRRPDPGAPWWAQVEAVVQPALTEESPRRLLTALAAGLPVLASEACGIGPRPGLTLTPADDGATLTIALRNRLEL